MVAHNIVLTWSKKLKKIISNSTFILAANKGSKEFTFFYLVNTMVFILDGNSEIAAHVIGKYLLFDLL